MGNISFLTGMPGHGGSPSLDEVLYQLENTSILFVDAWKRVPPDHQRAGRVSREAMALLDHVVNEFLRSRDTKKAAGVYASSSLKQQLDMHQGLMFSPATRQDQASLIACGPGNGTLPGQGTSITLEKLLNKIKHRQKDAENFRIDQTGRHIFLMTVDKPNQTPDSIVEFDVLNFCEHCRTASPSV
jgi:hypothetical protein